MSVLVTGANAKAVAEQVAKINGVKKILVAQDDKLKNNLPGKLHVSCIHWYRLERVAPMVVASQEQFKFSNIVAGSSAFSRGLIPRVAAKLGCSPISDVTEVTTAFVSS